MSVRPPARHELPEIDAAAFEAARRADSLLAAARRLAEADSSGAPPAERLGIAVPAPAHATSPRTATGPIPPAERWAGYFERLPDQLRDEPLPGLRAVARRIRAAYGPKDSIRDAFDPSLTEPLLDAVDRLLKEIARYEVHRG